MMQDTEMRILLFSFVFVIGMAMQAILMLWRKWESKDSILLLPALVLYILFALTTLTSSWSGDTLSFNLLLLGVLISCALAHGFRKRLLIHINGQMLIVWNVLFLIVLLKYFEANILILTICGIISIPTFLNIILNIDRNFKWQVFLYSWFYLMLAAIGAVYINFSALGIFIGTLDASVSAAEVFTAGATSFFLILSVWYVLALLPITLGDKKDVARRQVEVRNHIKLLESGYVSTKNSLRAYLPLILILFGFLLNYIFNVVRDEMLISLSIIVLSFWDIQPPSMSQDYDKETEWPEILAKKSIWTRDMTDVSVVKFGLFLWILAVVGVIVVEFLYQIKMF